MKIWDINIHILTKYVTFRKIVICMFQKKNPKLSKQTECDKDYGTDVLKGPGPLSPETLPSHFEGLIFLTQRPQHKVHDFVAYI